MLAHGVKEGLVASASEWEGLHCAEQLVDEQPRRFRWFNWSRRWQSKRKAGESPLVDHYDEALSEEVELTLAPLPHWAAEGAARRRARMQVLVAQVETDARRAREGPPMGPLAVRRQTTEPRPGRKRTVRPACHASTAQGRASFKHAYRAFCAAFRSAAGRWLAGDVSVVFPSGAFRPYLYEVRIV